MFTLCSVLPLMVTASLLYQEDSLIFADHSPSRGPSDGGKKHFKHTCNITVIGLKYHHISTVRP